MCRFLVYRGSDEILLSKLITDPTHSILRQSYDSRLRLDTRRGPSNPDGYGVGWYTDPKLGAEPCVFKSTTPVWNCSNLPRIASKTASRLIFGHVRATTEGSLSEENCHPFCHGSIMWMHNGGLGGWRYIKRRLGERLHDKWYLNVQGGTDSEWAFALFLDRLERLGFDPSSTPEKGFGSTVLRRAMLQTIEVINELTSSIPEKIVQSENVDTRSILNFAVSDGHSVICTRYVSSKTDEAASLYFSSGTQWEPRPSAGKDCDFQMDRRDKGAGIVLVASEPLTFEREKWVNVPTNSILTIHGQTVMVHPINDGFSERDPYHRRSSAFAQDKGLTTNEKAAARVASPLASAPGGDLDNHRLFPGSVIPSGTGRARTPEAPRSRATLSIMQQVPPLPAHITNFISNIGAAGAAAGTRSHHHHHHSSGGAGHSGLGISSGASISRPLSPPPNRPHTAGVKSPSQGNIKKKRRSLTAGEHAHPAEYVDVDASQAPDSPVIAPSTRGSELGTSEKAARVLGIGGFGPM